MRAEALLFQAATENVAKCRARKSPKRKAVYRKSWLGATVPRSDPGIRKILVVPAFRLGSKTQQIDPEKMLLQNGSIMVPRRRSC
jgi:hypothetical protein